MVAWGKAGELVGLMLPPSFTDFQDMHKGETVWVLGSGASIDHIPRRFWTDKIVVAVNFVGLRLGLIEYFSVTHYHIDAAILADARPDLPVIAPMIDQGGQAALPKAPPNPNIYYCKTGRQVYAQFDCAELWPKEPHTLVVGPTSLHMTMHFAQYLGAASIILAGADCGFLDGRSNFDGYSAGDNPMQVWDYQLPKVANQIRSEGVSVMSLNPFVNFAIEGHAYRGPSASIN